MTLEDATRALAAAGVENPRREARLLLAQAMGISRDASLTATPSPEQGAIFASHVARRAAHEPFAYIAGHKEFWSLGFDVGPGVLIPRPDTETLIEQARRVVEDQNAPLHVADLGTGSGAILVAALAEFPNATGIGFESSLQALSFARANAARLIGVRADIRATDWNEAAGPFDLVFSNPPYIPTADIESLSPDVSRYEPRQALDGGADGLDAYRGLAGLLPRILKPGGHALLEFGIGQETALERMFPGLEIVAIAPDLAGIPRCLVLRRV